MVELLTARERQILDLAAQHLTSKQIGPRLGIRPASVDTFMQTIIRKLGVAGRKEAIIVYLTAREAAEKAHRDNLDFGLSTMADAVEARPELGVVHRDDPDAHPIAFAPRPGYGSAFQRAGSWMLGSPVGRLVAIGLAATVLGLATLSAVAVGYGLNHAADRLLADHALHDRPEGRR